MEVTAEHLAAGIVLALLAFTGATCTCATLAARLKGQKMRHMLIAESRRRRHEYLSSLPNARGNSSVEVVESDVIEEEPTPRRAA